MTERIYKPDEIQELIDDSRESLLNKCYGKLDSDTKKRVEYYNFPIAFDIETTNYSFIDDDGKERDAAFMYVWQMSFAGRVIMGRKWDEFISVLNAIKKRLLLDDLHRIVIYIHNLGFEFSFIHKYLSVKRVFAISSRSPIIVETTDGVEFRCSYKLSGYSLDTLAKSLVEHDIRKLKGNLDYDLIRHSETPLTPQEIAYCVNDVQILIAYIEEEIKRNGNIAKIPMTATGYARRYCREECLNPADENGKRIEGRVTNRAYKKRMQALTLDPDEYTMLKAAFQGGFTHANAWYYNDTLENVSSYDFTSAYPANMVLEQYPMSKGEFVNVKNAAELKDLLKYYCLCFEAEFINLRRKPDVYESYLSRPRARYLSKAKLSDADGDGYCEDNKKIVRCHKCGYTITEQDFKIIQRVYTWDRLKIGRCIRYRKDYLPTELVKAILFLYRKKTELKNAWETADSDAQAKAILEMYMHYKALLNSVYGMCVTDIIRDLYEYDAELQEWKEPEKQDLIEALEKENSSKRRFLFYPWGVWTTAYSRYNLWTAILNLGADYAYSDTDSVKILHRTAHDDYFRKYNENIQIKIENAAKHHGLSEDDFKPKTIKGKIKPIGEWDYEGDYLKFKTLGSKRYLTLRYDDNPMSPTFGDFIYRLTVSGLDKSIATPYLFYHKHTKKPRQYYNDGTPCNAIWKTFTDGVYFPPGQTGKLTHKYLDDEYAGTVTDYLGNIGTYAEKSGTHLSGCDYSLSVEDDYKDFAEYLIELARIP